MTSVTSVADVTSQFLSEVSSFFPFTRVEMTGYQRRVHNTIITHTAGFLSNLPLSKIVKFRIFYEFKQSREMVMVPF